MTISADVHQEGGLRRRRPEGRTVIVRTNKATIYQDVDGSVAKEYHTVDAAQRVLQDQRSLSHVAQALENVRDADGWRYTVCRPLRADPSSGTIWLERAPGQTVYTLPTAALLDAEYRVGVWLATYHNRLFGEGEEGLIYADTNVGNIFVDPIGKVVTGSDPGSGWGLIGSRYQDVIRHAYSLLAVLLRRRASLRPLRAFLHGYASAARGRMTATSYVIALGRETSRRWRHYGFKSKSKQLLFAAGSILLSPLFAIYLPRTLAREMNANRGRGKEGFADT